MVQTMLKLAPSREPAQFQGRKQHGKGGTHQSSPSLPSKLPSSPVPCQCSMMDGLFLLRSRNWLQGCGK